MRGPRGLPLALGCREKVGTLQPPPPPGCGEVGLVIGIMACASDCAEHFTRMVSLQPHERPQ